MNCSHCGDHLPKGRKLKRCRPCNRKYMRRWYRKMIRRQTSLPAVDIDRIHYLRGAVVDPKRTK